MHQWGETLICSRTPRIAISIAVSAFMQLGANVAQSAEEDENTSRPSTTEQIRFFEKAVRPLFANHCVDCHGPDAQESELRLDSLTGMLTGGKAGPALVPGKPERSLLLTAVSYRDNSLQMPPDERLSDRQIADLTRWIKMGAPHPGGNKVPAMRSKQVDINAARRHWSFRPPAKPEIPPVHNREWVRTPIDAFVLSRLEAMNLKPVRPAGRRRLIRRATFDLIGLPPSPEEVTAFLADDSPEAWARVVDRLLDSPRYGERWGRHWLDVARYADSNGLDENVAHGNAWRYRDYVIDAFNNDKPYDQFLIEQLAGDQLDGWPDVTVRNERIIATGYLSLGPKVLAEVDERKMEMDIVDEQIDTIGRSLMGLTLGCARCHDHKFDPIEQRDYYALAGIFQSTRTMETFTKVARWNEVSIAASAENAMKDAHDRQIEEIKEEIKQRVAEANADVETRIAKGETVSTSPEEHNSDATKAKLAQLRQSLKQLEESTPVLPTAMAVTDGDVQNAAIHIRGSHLTLGETVARHFPRALSGDGPMKAIPKNRSGRLELARWLTQPDHPLTARVMVNRIWRWHFGKGLVTTTDNFGMTGAPPTHPQLLDWLAVRFVEEGWSVKAMHRLIMLSSTYQLGGSVRQSVESSIARHSKVSPASVDPQNQFYYRFDGRRLEAEAIRDAMLAVSGMLDRTMGGSLLTVGNREYLFNHTSQDKATYDTHRRSVYVPVIRNHLYAMFQLFDYSDASVLTGNRATSTTAPQALFLMNSPFVTDLAGVMARRSLTENIADRNRIDGLYLKAYARPATNREADRALAFIEQFADGAAVEGLDQKERRQQAWQAFCHAIISANEFVTIR